MSNDIKEIHHICGISVIPNSIKIQNGDISYKLSDIEIKAVRSRIQYLKKLPLPKKLYFYIDNPLMDIYEELAKNYPDKYGRLIKCYDDIKENMISNIGYDLCDDIEFININHLLKHNVEYKKVCQIAYDNFFIFEKEEKDMSLRYMTVDLNRLIICNNIFEDNISAVIYLDLDVQFPENINLDESKILDSINNSDKKSILLVKKTDPQFSSNQENQMIITTLQNDCIDNVIKNIFTICDNILNMQKRIPLDLVFRVLQGSFANKTNLENSKDPLFLLSNSINNKLNFTGDEDNIEIRNRNWKPSKISNELYNEYSQCTRKDYKISQDLKVNDFTQQNSRHIE